MNDEKMLVQTGLDLLFSCTSQYDESVCEVNWFDMLRSMQLEIIKVIEHQCREGATDERLLNFVKAVAML